MYTFFAVAALAASMGGHLCDDSQHHRCYPGFASGVENGLLDSAPPEDITRVYTPGYSEFSGRLWVGDDVKDIRSRRAWRENPGKVAYGAADAAGERVRVRVGNVAVSISPWKRVEAEGLENLERARQQWLAERGYTGGVRTFINPARLRAMQSGARSPVVVSEKEVPQPSATIRLRDPGAKGGVIRKVEAGVAGGARIVDGNEPVRISWPMIAKASTVQRAIARGWTESEDPARRTADVRR